MAGFIKQECAFCSVERFYIDACIWRDYFEDRRDNFRPLGEWAFRFMQKIIVNEDVVLISRLIEKELEKKYSIEEIESIISIIPEKLRMKISVSQSQLNEAKALSLKLRIPRNDALHAILARDNSAILITRDAHFIRLGIYWKKPEDLL